MKFIPYTDTITHRQADRFEMYHDNTYQMKSKRYGMMVSDQMYRFVKRLYTVQEMVLLKKQIQYAFFKWSRRERNIEKKGTPTAISAIQKMC